MSYLFDQYFQSLFDYSKQVYENAFKQYGFNAGDFEFLSFEDKFIIHKKGTIYRLVRRRNPYYRSRDIIFPSLKALDVRPAQFISLAKWLASINVHITQPSIINSQTDTAQAFLICLYDLEKNVSGNCIPRTLIEKQIGRNKVHSKTIKCLYDIGYIYIKKALINKWDQINLTQEGRRRIMNLTDTGLNTESNYQLTSVSNKPYDVGLSFSGHDREFVSRVAKFLELMQHEVYFDEDHKAKVWGKNLYSHLSEVYSKKCRYCIVFISKYYAESRWTLHELRAAQERAYLENREYILPVKFDDTEIPGLEASSIYYIDARTHTPFEIAELILKKLETQN